MVEKMDHRRGSRDGEGEPLGVIPHQPFVGEADHVVAEVKRQLLNDPRFSMREDGGTQTGDIRVPRRRHHL